MWCRSWERGHLARLNIAGLRPLRAGRPRSQERVAKHLAQQAARSARGAVCKDDGASRSLVIALGVTAVAGLMLGFAGVGSGMLMAPVFAILFGPIQTVAVIILMLLRRHVDGIDWHDDAERADRPQRARDRGDTSAGIRDDGAGRLQAVPAIERGTLPARGTRSSILCWALRAAPVGWRTDFAALSTCHASPVVVDSLSSRVTSRRQAFRRPLHKYQPACALAQCLPAGGPAGLPAFAVHRPLPARRTEKSTTTVFRAMVCLLQRVPNSRQKAIAHFGSPEAERRCENECSWSAIMSTICAIRP